MNEKNWESIMDLSVKIRTIASRARFNPSGYAGANGLIRMKVEEIKELLKTLPE